MYRRWNGGDGRGAACRAIAYTMSISDVVFAGLGRSSVGSRGGQTPTRGQTRVACKLGAARRRVRFSWWSWQAGIWMARLWVVRRGGYPRGGRLRTRHANRICHFGEQANQDPRHRISQDARYERETSESGQHVHRVDLGDDVLQRTVKRVGQLTGPCTLPGFAPFFIGFCCLSRSLDDSPPFVDLCNRL